MERFSNLLVAACLILVVGLAIKTFIIQPILDHQVKIAIIRNPQNLYDMLYNFWENSDHEQREQLKVVFSDILQLANKNQTHIERVGR